MTSHPAAGRSAALAAFLESGSWYRRLDPTLRALVDDTAREVSVGAGDCLVRAGSPSAHWFGMLRGYLQMYVVNADGVETTLYCLREGEWGGDGSLLKRERMRYDLRALTAADVCLIPASTFDALRFSSIDFCNFLCDVMNARMGEFVGMLAASRIGNPELQVARALLMLIDGQPKSIARLPVTQGALALISGLSRQRVNTSISLFNESGLVSSERRKGAIDVDVARLKQYLADASAPVER